MPSPVSSIAASGNPFYLEELVRCEAEGRSQDLPETVLALVQSRLECLEPDARRIVRAASVFGETFWEGGVAAVLGHSAGAADLRTWLDILATREVLAVPRTGRFPGTRQYAFRHGLLRDAAYAMLTDEDRLVGHRLAGAWLEGAGETDALAIAEHFERAEPSRAAPWFLAAGNLAYEGGHTEAAVALSARGLACGPNDADRVQMLGLHGGALAVGGQWRESVPFFREAMARSPEASPEWYAWAVLLLSAGNFSGDPELFASTLQTILSVSAAPTPSGPYALAVHSACSALGLSGQFGFAWSLLESAETLTRAASDADRAFIAVVRLTRAHLETLREEPGRALAALSKAREVIDLTVGANVRALAGMLSAAILAMTGECGRVEEAVGECVSIGLPVYSLLAKCFLASAQSRSGRPLEAVATARALIEQGDAVTASFARMIIAHSLVEAGEVDAAEQEAKVCLEHALMFPSMCAGALSVLSFVALSRGNAAEALEHADRAVEAFGRTGAAGIQMEWPRALALVALGRMDEARATISRARAGIMGVAATFEDPDLRDSYLTKITINARILEMADTLLATTASGHGVAGSTLYGPEANIPQDPHCPGSMRPSAPRRGIRMPYRPSICR